MRKFGCKTIKSILDRAITEFLNDDSAPELVGFFYKGHYVSATIDWSIALTSFYVFDFLVIYPRCVMRYHAGVDFDFSSAQC